MAATWSFAFVGVCRRMLRGFALHGFFAAAALLILGCSNGSPIPDGTPTPIPCPVEGYICERAAEFENQLLVKQDFDWIVENYGANSSVICKTLPVYSRTSTRVCVRAQA